MPIEIRPLRSYETAAARTLILDVASRLFRPGDPVGFIRQYDHTLEDVDTYTRDYSPPDGLLLAALDDGRLIGTGAIRRFDDETAELRRMWLLEPYQGRGIGYRLWLVLSDFARHAGYQCIRLTTDNENVRALAFYDRLGFYRIDPFDGLPHDIYMERVLNDNDEDEN